MSSLSALSRWWVEAACRHAWTIIIAATAIAGLCALYAAHNFRINTDLDAVLDSRLSWRLQAAQLEKLFPTLGENITIVIDGSTPELADRAASELERALQAPSSELESVERTNGGSFFDKEGLLYGSVPEVEESTRALIAAQPLLARVASDPSIRGLLRSLELGVAGAESDAHASSALERAAASMREVLVHAGDAQPKYLSWRGLMGESVSPEDSRQFITIVPRLDHASTAPAQAALLAIRNAVGRLQLDSRHGVRVRLTGSSVIADEELATLAESSGLIAGLMLLCMLAVLYAATRSVRVVAAVLLTTAMGAVMTGAIGLALVGQYTLISIAFLPLFAGLGVDFCIQLHASACAQPASAQLPERLSGAARSMGGALTLAALAIALAFFAFLPTAYRGVSELGLIAGIGIVIALLLSLCLLPALLVVLQAPILETRAPLAIHRVDAVMLRHHRAVLIGAAAVAVFAGAALPWIKVNFDPMVLRNPHTEAVSTYYELARRAETTPNTITATAQGSAEAAQLATQLAKLPQVGVVTTLQSLVPEDQSRKLALIGETRDLLDLSINPFTRMDAPTDAEIVPLLRRSAEQLRTAAVGSASLRANLRALGLELDRLCNVGVGQRAHAIELLMAGLPTALSQIANSLEAEPVTISTLPEVLRRQWLAPDGAARVEVAPAKPLLDAATTSEFVAAVRNVIPTATGDAVTVVESRDTVLTAFRWAGILSATAIAALLALMLRSLQGVVLAIAPILLAGVLTFGSCALAGVAINLENLIALPLLLGIGVAFNIYCVTAWASGTPIFLASSLSRGIVFSALTTGTSFATLMFSSHPGTSSMGALLLIALGWIVLTTLLVTPALAATMASGAATGVPWLLSRSGRPEQ